MIGWDLREDGIVVLTIDDPRQRANTMTDEFEAAFVSIVDRLEAERTTYRGAIITSGKDMFIAGADLTSLMNADASELVVTRARLDSYKQAFRRLELLGRPVVAAVNGTALGGGFEVALACHHRIALDARGSWLGLPEVTWGVLPGAGGVTRVVRMLGLTETMAEVLIEGRRFSPTEAAAAGLVDEVAATSDEMMERAAAWITAHPDAVQPWDRAGYLIPGEPGRSATGTDNLRLLRELTDPTLLPAPAAVLEVAVQVAATDLETAFAIETNYCADLICGQVSTNIVKAMFLDVNAVSKCPARPMEIERTDVARVRIVGNGALAAQVACVAARSGISVLLNGGVYETSRKTAGLAQAMLDEQVVAGELTKDRRDRALQLITVIEDPQGTSVDLVLTADEGTGKCSLWGPAVGPAEAVALRLWPSGSGTFRVGEIVTQSTIGKRALAGAVDFVRQLRLVPIVGATGVSFTASLRDALLYEVELLAGEGLRPEFVERAARESGLKYVGFSTSETDNAEKSREARNVGHDEDVRDRLLFAVSTEAVRRLSAGVVASEQEANVASILGLGFPVWTGGALQFARQYEGGVSAFFTRAGQLREKYGDRFDVAAQAEGFGAVTGLRREAT